MEARAEPPVPGSGLLRYPLRAYEYWVASYRRVWRGSVVSSLLNPVLYLTALGVGLGKLVNKGSHPLGVSYVSYVAPGMLAAVAMQIAAFESSWPVMAAIRWTRQYQAMLATPLRVRDVMAGHMLYVMTRVAGACTIYLVVLAAFGTLHSLLAVLVLPLSVLIGLAFCAPIAAIAAWAPKDNILSSLFRFGIMPLFLFSGTFFPLTRLPLVLRYFAYATPLWHGVDLSRRLTLGTATLGISVVHVAYLLVFAGLGIVLALRSFTRTLVR
jgi:lipooligosaccharide transport system permease protein